MGEEEKETREGGEANRVPARNTLQEALNK